MLPFEGHATLSLLGGVLDIADSSHAPRNAEAERSSLESTHVQVRLVARPASMLEECSTNTSILRGLFVAELAHFVRHHNAQHRVQESVDVQCPAIAVIVARKNPKVGSVERGSAERLGQPPKVARVDDRPPIGHVSKDEAKLHAIARVREALNDERDEATVLCKGQRPGQLASIEQRSSTPHPFVLATLREQGFFKQGNEGVRSNTQGTVEGTTERGVHVDALVDDKPPISPFLETANLREEAAHVLLPPAPFLLVEFCLNQVVGIFRHHGHPLGGHADVAAQHLGNGRKPAAQQYEWDQHKDRQ